MGRVEPLSGSVYPQGVLGKMLLTHTEMINWFYDRKAALKSRLGLFQFIDVCLWSASLHMSTLLENAEGIHCKV